MSYPTMYGDSEPTMCCVAEPVKGADHKNIREILDDTERILFETHDILLSIKRNIMNMANEENDVPKPVCMTDQAIINRNLSDMCRSYAIDIKRMLFGGELE